MVHRELIPTRTTELLLWGLRRRKRIVIRGGSMQPTLHEGDEVLVDSSAYRRRAPQPGDLVLVRHPLVLDTKLVKRIEAVDGRTGELELVGDNPDASTDSRSFGALPPSLLLGRITSRLP